MKKYIIIWALLIAVQAQALDLIVDPVNGDNSHDGSSPEKAFRTVEKARDVIRKQKLNQDMQEDVTVHLRGGRYELNDTLLFDSRDSGSNGHRVIYKAYQNESPIICGGRRINGWEPVPDKPYFVASVPSQKAVRLKRIKDSNYPPALHPRYYSLQTLSDEGFSDYFAQIYVNGVRAERARSHTPIVSSNKNWWDDPETIEMRDGIYVKNTDIEKYTNPEDLRILWLQEFKTADVPVKGVIPSGQDDSILQMGQPDFKQATSWHRINPSTYFFVVNALEELDEPGEWYLDRKKDLVYYYPNPCDGDLNKAEVYAPHVEFLVKIDGSPMKPVHHLRFEGITFQYGNWTERKDRYLGLSQAEIFKTYTSEFPGQIILDHADDIEIMGCTVRHMASCGIQLYEGCDNVTIEGNICYDTTGAGITVGRWWLDGRECPPASVCNNTMVRNNIVRNTGRDYWQATGINIFAAFDCKIHHNDISDTAYTALHARIGDSGYVHPGIGKLEYKWNKVSRSFAGHKWGIGDGGNLYMHGRYPNSLVAENYSLYANRNVNNEYYSDNFSHSVLWAKNISRYTQAGRPFKAWHGGNVDVVFDGNYSDKQSTNVGHAKQTNFHYIENDKWPEEALQIMAKAGIQKDWQHGLEKIYGHKNLTEGKVCEASSESSDANLAQAAVDGNWKSYWQSQADSQGDVWWQVDLGKEYVIQKVTILPRQDEFKPEMQSNIVVEGSNDPMFINYQTLCEQNEVSWYHKGDKKSSNMWEKFLPEMPPFRYLRVRRTGDGGVLNFAEFGAFGYPAK